MATTFARAANGDWLPLEPIAELPPGGFAALCGDDLSPLLGFDRRLFVAGVEPGLPGRPDAVCLSEHGELVLLVSFFGQQEDAALFRLLECAGALQGSDPAALGELCERASGSPSLGAWLAGQGAPGSADQLDTAVAASLADGRFELLAVVPQGRAERLVGPLRYLNRTGSHITCYELAAFGAGDVQTVQAHALDVGAAPAPALAAVPDLPREAPAPELVEDEPALPNPYEVESDPEDSADHEPVEFDEATVKLLDHLMDFCEQRFPQVAYDESGDSASMQAWLTDNEHAAWLLKVEGDGSVLIDFKALEPNARLQFASALGRMLGRNFGDPFTLGVEKLAIARDLNDPSLMEFFVELLAEMLDGTMGEDSGETVGDDFFADAREAS